MSLLGVNLRGVRALFVRSPAACACLGVGMLFDALLSTSQRATLTVHF